MERNIKNVFSQESPVDRLLMCIVHEILDKYILDVIKDPATLIKLVIAKVGNTSNRANSVRTLRRGRNKVVHSIPIDNKEAENLISTVRYVAEWSLTFSDIRRDKCVSICKEILEDINLTIPNSLTIPSIVDDNIIRGKLIDLKHEYREYIKGKKIRILDGSLAGKVVRFKSWNGNNVKIMIDETQKLIPLFRQVEILLTCDQ